MIVRLQRLGGYCSVHVTRRGLPLLKLSVIKIFIWGNPLALDKRPLKSVLIKARGEMPSPKLSDGKDYILTA